MVSRDGGDMYHGISKARHVPPSALRESIFLTRFDPCLCLMPLFPNNSRAPDILPCNIFAKQPSLSSYDRYIRVHNQTALQMACSEADICELLQQYPHPNIAVYTGGKLPTAKCEHILCKEASSHLNGKNTLRTRSRV